MVGGGGSGCVGFSSWLGLNHDTCPWCFFEDLRSDNTPVCIVLLWYLPRRFQCFVSNCHCEFSPPVSRIWWPFLVLWITLFSSSGRGEFVMKSFLSSISCALCVWSFRDASGVEMTEKSCDICMLFSSTTLSDLWC